MTNLQKFQRVPNFANNLNSFKRFKNVEKLKTHSIIAASLSVILKPNAKGQKRDSNVLAAKKQALKDFKIEYSKSSRALCRGCEQKILKDEVL